MWIFVDLRMCKLMRRCGFYDDLRFGATCAIIKKKLQKNRLYRMAFITFCLPAQIKKALFFIDVKNL